MKKTSVLIFVLLCLSPRFLHADIIEINGSELADGEITGESADEILFKDNGGRIRALQAKSVRVLERTPKANLLVKSVKNITAAAKRTVSKIADKVSDGKRAFDREAKKMSAPIQSSKQHEVSGYAKIMNQAAEASKAMHAKNKEVNRELSKADSGEWGTSGDGDGSSKGRFRSL